MELVILGTAAGRTSWRGSALGGFSAAISCGGDVYVVDFGRNWLDRFYDAGLGGDGFPGSPGGLETLRAGFITHLHADHVVDLPRLVLFGEADGLAKRRTPMRLFGPGNRGALYEPAPGLAGGGAPIGGTRPTPGTVEMIELLQQAFAADLNESILDSGAVGPGSFLDVTDIEVPTEVRASASNAAPAMEPFEVYADEHLTVTATLVDHAPMFPAFGFRFDSAAGSVTFSGDSVPSENLIRLARGSDVLVHEVADCDFFRRVFRDAESPRQRAKLRHLTEAHTDLTEVGAIPQRAGVRMMVLAHLGPIHLAQRDIDRRVAGFDGPTVLGHPLTRVTLPDLGVTQPASAVADDEAPPR